MIRYLSVLALCSGLAVSASAPAAPARPLHLTQAWQVALDASGKVTQLKTRGDLKAAVREPLEQAIRGWTFIPGHVDGRAAPTDTILTLDVSFVPAPGDKYSVRIDDARTGGRIDSDSSRKTWPRFPRDAMHPGLVARVVVKADYDADGRIVSVAVQPDQGIHATRSLDAATIAAVKKWTVDPERVAGHGVAASLMVPICYTVGYPPHDFDCSWTPPGTRSTIDNGDAYALAPTVQLKSDVIGRTL